MSRPTKTPFIPPTCICTWHDPGASGHLIRRVERTCPVHGTYVDVPLPLDIPGLDSDRTDTTEGERNGAT